MKWSKEQLDAIKFRKGNALVSASAGSGKTSVLTQRIYEIIKEGCSLDELLVLTFTNNAAAEMRERIRQKLVDDGLNSIASSIDAVNIQTFDAYALSIVKKHHYEIGLSNNINIVDENILLLKSKKIINDIFEDYYDKNNETFENLIYQYCVKSDSVLKNFILSIYRKINLVNNPDDYITHYEKKFFDTDFINSYIQTLHTEVIKCIDNIYKLIYQMDNCDLADELLLIFSSLKNVSSYDEIVKCFKNCEFNMPKSAGKLKAEEDDKQRKEIIKSYVLKLIDITSFGCKEEIYDKFNSNKQNELFILDIVKQLNQKMEVFKQQYEVFTFNDIAFLAKRILSIEHIKSFYKNKYKYILIDEYQDTSDTQEEMINVIENNNVFVVGDVKQSIYRFRNANCDLFLNKMLNYQNDINGKLILLPDNFRSRKEVIKDINDVFIQLMREENVQYSYEEGHIMIAGNNTYEINKPSQDYFSEILSYSKMKTMSVMEVEAHLIAQDIIKKINEGYLVHTNKGYMPCSFKDFCILISSKTNFDIFQKVFSKYSIPLFAKYDININEFDLTMVFKNIIKLLKLIQNNDYSSKFLHAYMSLLRSFLFCIDDKALEDIILNKCFHKNEAYNILLDIVHSLDILSLSEIIELIIVKFKIEDKLHLVGDINNNLFLLNYFVSQARQMDRFHYNLNDLSTFFEDLEEESLETSLENFDKVDNSVQLMSVHASKGLQFNIIYYSGIHKVFFDDCKNQFLFDIDYGIVLPNYNYDNPYNVNKYIYRSKEKIEGIKEQTRLFYVALTRAKEKIIILNAKSKTNKPKLFFEDINSFKDILSYSKVKFNECDIELNEQEKPILQECIRSNDKITIKHINPMSDDKFIKNKASKEIDVSSDNEFMEKGTKLHHILENVDFIKKDLSFIKNNEDKKIIEEFLKLPIFNKSNLCKVCHEYKFFDEINGINGVIDLILIYDDCIDIVDFKLSNLDDEHYKTQLKIYEDYIRSISNKKINLYLASIIKKEVKIIK